MIDYVGEEYNIGRAIRERHRPCIPDHKASPASSRSLRRLDTRLTLVDSHNVRTGFEQWHREEPATTTEIVYRLSAHVSTSCPNQLESERGKVLKRTKSRSARYPPFVGMS
jgi:hypothetical protein